MGSRLGPFEIIGELGRGAMGRVMRARHVEMELEAAIKIVAVELGGQASWRAAFEREARAVSALHHRAITAVYDYGTTEEATDLWPVGAPWLAMELAPLGCLADHALELNWRRTRGLLVQLLEGLAHAHARGVIHRDLKPANVLVLSDGAEGLRCQLTDFGVAHPIDLRQPRTTQQIPARSAGTPAYMAPEQIEGQWREFGPWTDLYALGCMAWELVTGSPPFLGPGVLALALQHLHESPGVFSPRFAVPTGFEAWLRTLLGKSPSSRFVDAASARVALDSLGEPVESSGVEVRPGRAWSVDVGVMTRTLSRSELEGLTATAVPVAESDPFGETAWSQEHVGLAETMASGAEGLAATVASDATRTVPVDPAGGPRRGAGLEEARLAWPSVPMPEDWRDPVQYEGFATLLGAGLGLFELRDPPIEGREQERDRLWAAFGRVHATGRAHAVLLRGSLGMGKRTLATWLTRRVEELGVATALPRASALLGPGRAMARALGLHLRTHGLPPARAAERVAARLFGDREQASSGTVAEILALLRQDEDGADRMEPASALRALHTALAALAWRGPVIVAIDDVEQDPDLVQAVVALLELQDVAPLPLLLVLTSQSDVVRPDTPEADRVGALVAHDAVETLTLEPLSRQDTWALLTRMLLLDHELMFLLEARSAGVPLVLVQLVRTCLRQGIVRAGRDGFYVRSAESFILPAESLALAGWGLEAMLAALPEPDRFDALRALCVAAAIGGWTHWQEWEAACGIGGVRIPEGLIPTAVRFGIVRLDDDRSWTWTSSLTREALEQHAHVAGHWMADHFACAEMLRRGHSPMRLMVHHRVGGHLLASGRGAEALPWLFAGAQEALGVAHFGLAARDLNIIGTVLDDLQVPESAPQRAVVTLMSARIALDRGLVQDAVSLLEGRAWDLGALASDAASWLHRLRAAAAARQSRHAEARHHLELAQQVDRAIGHPFLLADDLRMTGHIRRLEGCLEDALVALDEADAALDGCDPAQPATITARRTIALERGAALTEMGRPAEGLVVFEAAAADARVYDDLYNGGLASMGRGVALRWLARHQEAGEALDQALEELKWFGSQQLYLVHLHRALLRLQTDRAAEAVELLRRHRHDFTRANLPLARALLLASLAWGLAACADPAGAQAELEALDEHLRHHPTGHIELDLALGEVAALAHRSGQRALASLADALKGSALPTF